jgi:glutamate racemase
MKRANILVFDSGVGGVSVLRHLRRMLPQENFLYYGDDANAPYGAKTTRQVQELTMAVIENLLSRGPAKALVVACNTATSAAIGQLRQKYPDLIVVGIEPALKPAADRFPGGHIGIMATRVTLREKKLKDLMARYGENCTISCIPAPGLVELVEQGLGNTAQAEALLRPILEPYRDKLDALVLGCTHYPFAEAAITRILGERTLLLDGGEGTARQTRRRLAEAGLLYEGEEPGTVRIEHSGSAEKFETLVRTLME